MSACSVAHIRPLLTSPACRIYDLALFTYLFAFFHFGSEILIFGTAKLQGAAISPVLVACEWYCSAPSGSAFTCSPYLTASSLVWMLTQYKFYVHS